MPGEQEARSAKVALASFGMRLLKEIGKPEPLGRVRGNRTRHSMHQIGGLGYARTIGISFG